MDKSDEPGEKTRFRVKLGNAELEYEGGTQFLKEEVMPAVAKIFQIVELRSDLTAPPPAPAALLEHSPAPASAPASATPSASAVVGHTAGSIAAICEAKSAADLVMASAAYLTLYAAKERFTRSELLEAMRSATGFYKKSDGPNLSTTLRSVLKSGRLREADGGSYVLSPKARHEMELKIAEAN